MNSPDDYITVKCCGNCFWFDGEDIYGWGFCDEKEVQMYCGSSCVRWKERRAKDDGILRQANKNV